MLDHDTTLERKKGSVPEQNKIDVHHHFVPSFYAKAIQDAGGDPSGWHLPTWSPSSSLELMSSVGTSTAILSLTAPGTGIVDGQASRDLARQANEFAAKVRDSDPSKFGFFASLPSLLDVEGSLTEIAHAYDFLKTDGVTLFTRYGNDYLGSPKFASIWSELNKRAAVVFIHPTHSANNNFVNPELPQPVIDFPHETTRTAVDLIMSNTKRNHPNCKIILSHAGGTLPYLVQRVANIAPYLPRSAGPKSGQEVLEDAKSFYFDLALSSSNVVLGALLNFAPHDQILYGSDFPYAPVPCITSFSDDLEAYPMEQILRDKVNFVNALALFPRLNKSA